MFYSQILSGNKNMHNDEDQHTTTIANLAASYPGNEAARKVPAGI